MCEKMLSNKKKSGMYKYLSLSKDLKALGNTWMPICQADMKGISHLHCPDIQMDKYYFPLFAPNNSTFFLRSVSFYPRDLGEESKMKTKRESLKNILNI